ncbi:MAG: phosphatidylglycerophosphatase A [Oligoflexus sp.]
MKATRPKLTLSSVLATAYPLGFIPKAPGTWGSLPGLLLGWGIYQLSLSFAEVWLQYSLAIVVLLLMTLGAYWIIAQTEKEWQSHDDKRIVIDEVVGQAIPIAFLGSNIYWMIMGFLLFRFFDILKPGPIGWADRNLPGAWGTLIDDVMAGAAALLVLIIAAILM